MLNLEQITLLTESIFFINTPSLLTYFSKICIEQAWGPPTWCEGLIYSTSVVVAKTKEGDQVTWTAIEIKLSKLNTLKIESPLEIITS